MIDGLGRKFEEGAPLILAVGPPVERCSKASYFVATSVRELGQTQQGKTSGRHVIRDTANGWGFALTTPARKAQSELSIAHEVHDAPLGLD